MGFDRLKFTKRWTSHTDFPTVETDESQVRADMQLLHDEAKDGLNKLEEELEAGTAATSLGAKSPATGADSNVQTELEALYKAHTSAGGIPAAGLEGQVLAKASDENYAASWQNVSDLVAHLKGKAGWFAGLDSNGKLLYTNLPDNLYKTVQHCWRRTTLTAGYAAEEGGVTSLKVYADTDTGTEMTVSYGSAIAVSASGVLSLSGTTGTISYDYYSYSGWTSTVAGKYFQYNGGFYRMPSDATITKDKSTDDDGDKHFYVYVTAIPISAVELQPGVDYVCSTDRYAYLDRGEVDGFFYEYTGTVVEKAIATPKMAWGTYVGGAADSCKAELGFTPVFFAVADTSDSGLRDHFVMYMGYGDCAYATFQYENGVFSWTGSNTNGHVYAWFAIGG